MARSASTGSPPSRSTSCTGGEPIEIEGEPHPPPLHAIPEDIPLDILYEDQYLAIINKPAGMMVHAGSGATDDARNRGTLVNALLHHFAKLSDVGGELRPGIVHRLDKQTSGIIVVAKDDSTHRKLGEMFSQRADRKDLYRARSRQRGQGRHHRQPADRARSGPPHPHDDAPGGWTLALSRM